MKRLLFWASGFLPCRLINRGAPYMERYAVFECPFFTVLLHRFVSGDGDEELHDHPWRWAVSLILAGRYFEERVGGRAIGRPFKYRLSREWLTMLFIGPDTFHRIVVTQPDTWTLFIHGKRMRQWGWLDHEWRWHPAVDPVGRAQWKQTAPRGRDAGREPLAS